MSESVPNVEIEDVLSSIRRLVTDEGRPHGRRTDPKASQPVGRLVLTPALRVADKPAVPAFKHSVQAAPTPEELVEMAQKSAGTAADPVSPPWRDPDITLHQAAAWAQDFVHEAEDLDDSGNGPDLPAPQAREADEAGDKLTTEAAEPAEDDTPEPVLDVTVKAKPVATPPKPARTGNLSAKIEALEAAIAQGGDQFEPDGQAGGDFGGTPFPSLRWREPSGSEAFKTVRDAAPEAAKTAPEPQISDSESKASGEDLTAEDGFIDEEALRELVADIVRQELQGALGERITRNVRKLVRREIHRALSTQEFD